MKLRLPLLLRLALLSTAAAYTLGSGCLFADDAPADAAQDDPIAEAVDEEESDSPAIGFEGYTESQLVDIQSSDSAGAVIRQMLENSTTGAVANVGTSSSTSNGATTAAESPALTLSAPAEPAADTALTTSTLSDSAGEGAVAPFFSAEEAAALVVASPATSTPSVKNASTATTFLSDETSDTAVSSTVATGSTSSGASLGSVGSSGAASGGASSGSSASYSLSSTADSSSSSLATTTEDTTTSSDPIAEEVLEDTTTEETTTSSSPLSSASTLATTASTPAARTFSLKLLGSTETTTQGPVTVDGETVQNSDTSTDFRKGVQYREGKLGDNITDVKILYLHATTTHPDEVAVAADSFYIVPANSKGAPFSIGTLTTSNANSTIIVQNNEWKGDEAGWNLNLTIGTLKIKGSAVLDINKTRECALGVTIKSVENTLENSGVPVLTKVTNSGTLTLGTNRSEGVEASTVSIGTLTNKANGTMTLNGTTTVTGSFSNEGKLTNNGTLTLGSGSSLNLDQFNLSYATDSVTENGVCTVKKGYLIAWGNGDIINEGATVFQGSTELSDVTASGNYLILSDAASELCYVVAVNASYSNVLQESSALTKVVVKKGVTLSVVESSLTHNICGDGIVQIAGNILYENEEKLDGVFGTIEVGSGGILDFGEASSGLSYADNVKILFGGKLTASGADFTRSFELAGGELTSSGSETYSGTITISSDSKVSSSKNGTTTLSGTLSGSSALTISGEGTVLLSGNISGFTGPISVESGTLQFTSGTKAAVNGSKVSVAEGATLDINGFADTCFTVELKGGTLKNGGGECSENSRQIDSISLTEDSILQADKKFGLVGSGYGNTTINLAGKTLTKKGEGKFFANNVALTGGGTLKIAQGEFELRQSNGKSLSTLGDTNSSTNIWLLNGTTLSGGFTMNHEAEFKLDDEDAGTDGKATISANINANSKEAKFNVASGDTLTLSGNLTEGGKVTKSEAGVLEMSGSNGVSALTVSGGVVKLTGSTEVKGGGSAIQLNSSGSIQLTGSGKLVNDYVTFSALSEETANLKRNTEKLGDFNLWGGGAAGNVIIENAKVSFSSDRQIYATLTNVELVNDSLTYIDLKGNDSSLNRLSARGAFTLSNGNTTTVYGQDSSVAGTTTVNAKSHLKIADSLSMKLGVKIGTGSDASSSATTASLSIIGSDQSSVVVVTSKKDDAEATITGGVTMKYDAANAQAVLTGASGTDVTSLTNAALSVSEGKTLQIEQNVTVSSDSGISNTAGTVKIGDGATSSSFVLQGEYSATGESASLQVQENATLKINNGDTAVTTITNRDASASSATVEGGVTMKYDSVISKAVISGGRNGSSATITNSLLTVANGSTLSLQNVILAGNTQISAGTAAAAAVALLDEGSGESSGTATTVDLTDSVIQLSKENATPDTNPVGDLTKGSTLTKTGTTGGEGNTLPIQQDTAKVYTIDYTGATGVTLTGALTFDFDTFTVEGMTGSGYYLLNELLKEYDYVALRFADDVMVDPKTVAVTSKVTMGTETVTSTGYYVGGTNGVVNSNGTSGVVVYFDSMALPEPTTSTLGLLALAALCARRRRSRTRAHAEHA